MSDTALTINVPTELNNLGALTQNIVGQIKSGANWLTVLSSSLPVLFAEGAQWTEIQAEFKDPQAIVLAGIVLGEVVAALVAAKVAAAKMPAAPAV